MPASAGASTDSTERGSSWAIQPTRSCRDGGRRRVSASSACVEESLLDPDNEDNGANPSIDEMDLDDAPITRIETPEPAFYIDAPTPVVPLAEETVEGDVTVSPSSREIVGRVISDVLCGARKLRPLALGARLRNDRKFVHDTVFTIG